MSLSLTGFRSCRPVTVARSLSHESAFAFIAAAAIFAAVLWLPVVLRDPDTLWHITTGGWILAHHAVPALDTFSYTAAGKPWMAHEWLSEVILALAYGWASWNGLMILTAASAACAIGLVAFYVRRHARADIAVMLVLLAVACGGPSLLSRPHVIALPLVALWTIGLVAARARGRAPSLTFLPVMTLWANLHGGFLLGLVLAAAMGTEALFDPACVRRDVVRNWGIFIGGAVVAAAITPMGIDTLLFPFRLMSMQNLYQIQEWKPTDFSQLSGVTVSILVALYLGLTGTLRLPRFRVLLVAGLVFSTMQHVRNVQLFGILVPLLIADSLGQVGPLRVSPKFRLPEWAPTWIVGVAAVLSLAFRIGLPLDRIDEGGYASAALASVPADLRAKPVLNEYGFGGLLIFEGVKPFIDGRADLYGDAFMETYLSIVHSKGDLLDGVLCRYGVEWTMFGPNTVVPALMDRTPGWHRIYSDKVAVIHVRDDQSSRPVCPAPAS
ncbi:MAG TPA: hypothetical protein DDZ81_09460 [Acetobacteraceae bacterium]|jgi:hypothetical protein|nr:hypothetical protein [Acetobacteraceae bacterium]